MREGTFHAALAAILLLAALVSGHAQQKPLNPADASLPQLWITLGHRLDVDKVKPGDAIPGITLGFFAFRTCAIQQGYVLHGKVMAVHPWSESSHKASIDVKFETECLDGTTLPLTLIAAYEPIPNGGRQVDIITSLPVNINPNYSSHMDPKYPNMPPSNDASFPIPVAQPGEVHRIQHLALLVAGGAEASSSLVGDQKRLRVEEGTRFGLVPAQIPAKPGR